MPRSNLTNRQLLYFAAVLTVLASLPAISNDAASKKNTTPKDSSSRINRTSQGISVITQALHLYKLDNYRYPTVSQGLSALLTIPSIPPIPLNYRSEGYLLRLPKDQWGNDFKYALTNGEITVFSTGADGNSRIELD